MSQELQLQSQFYEVSKGIQNGKIGVPEPKYYCEIANNKMIAMEKLRARSIDDLLRGVAKLPVWFTEEHVDILCTELERTITAFHDKGLFHRDLHFGNIMITSKPNLEKGDTLGYIIDFGLSGKGVEGLDPYKKVTDERVFTYDDDYGRILVAKKELKSLIQRNV